MNAVTSLKPRFNFLFLLFLKLPLPRAWVFDNIFIREMTPYLGKKCVFETFKYFFK